MTESRKTLTYGAVGLVLLLAALLTAPKRTTPDAFLDQGEALFPEFTDPNIATTLEVIEFDEETASARPFKVTFKDGKWTIPSHHDYAADGKDRLAKTAAGVIGIKKDDLRSNNVADHEACGVIDPLDNKATSLKGRGKRVTIKGQGDQVLADLIIGKEVEGRQNLRFVRIPTQKTVYVSKIDIDISTKFEDWIERDLMQVNKSDIDTVTIKDYSINEMTRSVNQRDVLVLNKRDDGTWTANRMSAGQEVDETKMNALLQALDDLSIVGVRPKPAGLTASLKRAEGGMQITQEDFLSLQSRGYYFTRDGNLLSNEGELEVRTSDGVIYTLRFGEVLYGTGEAVTAGGESTDTEQGGPGENRYLFLSAAFDPKRLIEPQTAADTAFLDKAEEDWTDADRRNKEFKDAHDEWEKKFNGARDRASELRDRFADWYYVISSSSFDKVHLKRSDLIKRKEASTASS